MLMLSISACVCSVEARTLTTRALSAIAVLRVYDNARAFRRSVRQDGVAVGVVELRCNSQVLVPLIAALRAENPGVLLVGLLGAKSRESALLVPAANAGIDAVAIVGVDDLQQVVEDLLARTMSTGVNAHVFSFLEGEISKAAGAILDACVEVGPGDSDGGALAKLLGVSWSTLSRRCTDSGLLPPASTLRWVRLLIAASRMANEKLSVEAAALDAGFESAGTFRRVLHRATGLRPDNLRKPGGLASVQRAFRAALSPRGGLERSG
jgi:AraC-like DNA-binding protein